MDFLDLANEIDADWDTQVLETAVARGLKICKYADPTEGAREGLTVDEAKEVCDEDSSLIYFV